jgi:hypothetical protein
LGGIVVVDASAIVGVATITIAYHCVTCQERRILWQWFLELYECGHCLHTRQNELNFHSCLSRGQAKTMSAAEIPLEGCRVDARVMGGLRLDDHIST